MGAVGAVGAVGAAAHQPAGQTPASGMESREQFQTHIMDG